jgi:maltose O-acetyltransferase
LQFCVADRLIFAPCTVAGFIEIDVSLALNRRSTYCCNELSSSYDRLPARIARLAREELGLLQPSLLLATACSQLLPHMRLSFVRTSILRGAGFKIGERSRIMGPMHVTGEGDYRTQISIGDDTFISGPLRIDLAASVSIGSRVYIGHEVMLLTIDHEIGTSERRCGPHATAPVIIGDGAWIASRAVILAGVTVGAGSVVAAGAVVTRNVPPDTLVAGTPARVIRALEDVQPLSERLREPERQAFPSGTYRLNVGSGS